MVESCPLFYFFTDEMLILMFYNLRMKGVIEFFRLLDAGNNSCHASFFSRSTKQSRIVHPAISTITGLCLEKFSRRKNESMKTQGKIQARSSQQESSTDLAWIKKCRKTNPSWCFAFGTIFYKYVRLGDIINDINLHAS